MPIDTVLFDLDDTLVEFTRTTEEVLDATYREIGIDPIFPASAYVATFDEFLDESDDLPELRANCFAKLAADNGDDRTIGHEMAEVYSSLRNPTDVRFIDGASQTLDSLAAEFTLGIVTNGPPTVQQPKIDAVSLDRWAETIVYGGFDAPAKPSPEPFDLAIDALDATREETVVVGNSLQSDIAGANAAGMTSVWIPSAAETAGEIRPDYRVEALSELVPPVWQD